MSSSKQLFINCGASRITAAVASQSGGNLQFDRLVTEELHYDLSKDDGWIDAVGEALNVLSKQHKLSGKASFIIPGNQVLTKSIKVPQVDESKRAQIVAFEAQQNIPYPLHEVVWDTQEVGNDGVETEVLFIACKSVTIDAFCSTVSRAGFEVTDINAATILDYNAIQFAQAGLESDTLLINIGARSTNLLFASGEGFYVRNIQSGGNTFTQGIADSLGKSFSTAEEIKHKYISGELTQSEDDSGAQLLKTAADSFVRRMSQDITRSIVNYRRRGGTAPTRILLTGRGALLPNLSEQLSASQKLPVEFFDPLQNVTLDSSIDSKLIRLETSELIGAAATSLVPRGASVNLLPEEVQEEMVFATKKPFIIAAAILLAAAPWPAYLGYQKLAEKYESVEKSVQATLTPLQAKQSEIFENTDQAELVSASISQVEGLVNTKTNWIQFFGQLQDSLAETEDAWLESLSVKREIAEEGSPTYEVQLEGQMLIRESADSDGSFDEALITQRIKQMISSFESSDFIVASRPPNIRWSELRNGLNVLPFSINLEVDTQKPL